METNVEDAPDAVLPGGVEPLWDMRDLTKFLRLGYTRTWQLIHQHGLPAYQFGCETSPLRFDPSEVRAWAEQYKNVLRPRKAS